MRILSPILIYSLLVSPIMAQDALFLEKGTTAPWDGYLFNPEATKQIKARLVDADILDKMVESLKVQVNLHENIDKQNEMRYNLVLEQNDKLSLALKNQQSFNTTERILWFFGGVLATILVTYGVRQAIQ